MPSALLTLHLKKRGRNYEPLFNYFRRFPHREGMGPIWQLVSSIPMDNLPLR